MTHRDLTGRLLLEPVRAPCRAGRSAARRLPWHARRTALLLAMVFLLGVSGPWSPRAAEEDSVQALLDRADAVRSADPAEFRMLLDELETRIPQASQAQVEQLRYLQAYRLSLDGRFNQAIEALHDLAAHATDPATRFRATVFLANNYAHTRDFSAGLQALDRALSMLPRIANADLRHQGLMAAAVLYNQAGQYELALPYAESTLQEAGAARTRCLAGILKLESLFALNRLPEDPAVFEPQIADCEKHNEHLLAGFVRGFQAQTLLAAGRPREAVELLESRLATIEQTAYPRLVAEIHAVLAEAHLAQGHYVQARRHAERVVETSEGVPFSRPLIAAYRTLSLEAEQRGDLAAALQFQRRHAEVDRAFLDDIKARELAFQLAQHDNLQKTHTIELLNQRNEMLRLESEIAKQAVVNTRLAIALLVILLAAIGLWAYQVKRDQVRFRRLAQTDALTGISNRLHFSQRAPGMLADCARHGQPVALVMFDLDGFKTINDRHGHACGDWVLVEVARVCRAQCAPGDLMARLGGEEFAILRPGADVEAARELADRCRRVVAALDTAPSGTRFPVSASFGVAVARPGLECGLDALLVQADIALYCAKTGGRNRVSVYGPGAMQAAGTAERAMPTSA